MIKKKFLDHFIYFLGHCLPDYIFIINYALDSDSVYLVVYKKETENVSLDTLLKVIFITESTVHVFQ